MEEYTNGELGILIREGFKGVHARQDKANHQIAKNLECIDDISGWKNKMVGGIIVMNVFLVPLVLYFGIELVKKII